MSTGRLVTWKEWGPSYMRKLGYSESEIIKTFPHLIPSKFTKIGMDIVKSGIAPYLEPDCETLTRSGKTCGDRNIFKSRGKTKSCEKYCIEQCDQWVVDLVYNIPSLQNFNPETKMWEGPYKDIQIRIYSKELGRLFLFDDGYWSESIKQKPDESGFIRDVAMFANVTPKEIITSICSHIKLSGKIYIDVIFQGKYFNLGSEALSIILGPIDYRYHNIIQVR